MRGPAGQSDRLLMICFTDAEPTGRRLLGEVMTGWHNHAAPVAETHPPESLYHGELSVGGSVVWLVAGDRTHADQLYQALETLGQQHVPILLTRADAADIPGASFQPGVVTAPPTMPTEQLRLMLRVLFNQAENLRHIRQELRITRMHHGGLRGQIDKLDEELRLAACVQREFLPQKVPEVSGLEIDVLFQPATYVSGDIYDVLRLDEHHVGFWIADVVGHGVPAALMTMFVKRALPTKEIADKHYRLIPPKEALGRLNHEMVNRSSGNVRFATAVYGVIDTRNARLQIARAGHPFPLLLRPDGTVRSLEPEGPLLGVFDDDAFEQMEVDLAAGDRLLLYSDGFEFAFGGERGEFRQEDYETAFANLAEGGFEDAIQRLHGVIDHMPGSLHQPDDLTALLIGVKSTAETEPHDRGETNLSHKPSADVLTAAGLADDDPN